MYPIWLHVACISIVTLGFCVLFFEVSLSRQYNDKWFIHRFNQYRLWWVYHNNFSIMLLLWSDWNRHKIQKKKMCFSTLAHTNRTSRFPLDRFRFLFFIFFSIEMNWDQWTAINTELLWHLTKVFLVICLPSFSLSLSHARSLALALSHARPLSSNRFIYIGDLCIYRSHSFIIRLIPFIR